MVKDQYLGFLCVLPNAHLDGESLHGIVRFHEKSLGSFVGQSSPVRPMLWSPFLPRVRCTYWPYRTNKKHEQNTYLDESKFVLTLVPLLLSAAIS